MRERRTHSFNGPDPVRLGVAPERTCRGPHPGGPLRLSHTITITPSPPNLRSPSRIYVTVYARRARRRYLPFQSHEAREDEREDNAQLAQKWSGFLAWPCPQMGHTTVHV
jgi:hypothetical protein